VLPSRLTCLATGLKKDVMSFRKECLAYNRAFYKESFRKECLAYNRAFYKDKKDDFMAFNYLILI
jgi:hypothetical protein